MIVLAGAEWAARNTGAAEHAIAAEVSKETGAE
jgi:hypothetical protein